MKILQGKNLSKIRLFSLFTIILLTIRVNTEAAPSDANKPETKPNEASKPSTEGDKPSESGEKASSSDTEKKSMDTDDGDKESEESALEEKCNTDLVRAFGMQGRVTPTLAPLDMCPTVRRSCCRVKDQLVMYASWQLGGQRRLIRDRFDHISEIYMRYIDVMKRIRIRVLEAYEKNRHQKVSNCNIMGERISKFELNELGEQIEMNIKKMEGFFKSAYKGFYCGICNFDNHRFFDLEAKKLKVDEAFCLKTVESSLSTLIFFYDDIIEYNNLVSMYMKSCNMRSQYSFGQKIPEIMTFKVNEKIVKPLRHCRRNRNKHNWLEFCRPICDKFSVVGLSGYFEPYLEKIELYTKWLQALLSEKIIEETQPYDIRSKHRKKSMSDLLVEGATLVVTSVKDAAKSKGDAGDAKDAEKKKEEATTEKKETKKPSKLRRNRILTADKPEDKPGKNPEANKEGKGKEGEGSSKESGKAPKEGDKAADAKENQEAEGTVRAELVVFRNDLDGKFPLQEFVYEYMEEGIDFAIEGKNTLCRKEVYMQVKALLSLSNIISNKPNFASMYLKDWGGKFARLTSSLFGRNLKSAWRVVSSVVVSLGLLTLV